MCDVPFRNAVILVLEDRHIRPSVVLRGGRFASMYSVIDNTETALK